MRPPDPVGPGQQEGSERVTVSMGVAMGVTAEASGPPAPASDVRRLWVRLPDRMRLEVPLGSGVRQTVHVGSTRWAVFGPGDAQVAEVANPLPDDRLLFPARLVDSLELGASRPARVGEREAFTVSARPHGRGPVSLGSTPVGRSVLRGANELVLSVDAEHGVMLLVEAKVEEQVFERVEFTEVAFDEPVSDEVFVLEAPEGTEFLPPAPCDLDVALEEVGRHVSFPVFVPTSPAAVTATRRPGPVVRVTPADPVRGSAAQVAMTFPLEQDGRHAGNLWVRQSDRPLPRLPDDRWEQRGRYLVASDTRQGYQRCKLRLRRDGTHLHLEATNRELGWLEQIAGSLRRLSG